MNNHFIFDGNVSKISLGTVFSTLAIHHDRLSILDFNMESSDAEPGQILYHGEKVLDNKGTSDSNSNSVHHNINKLYQDQTGKKYLFIKQNPLHT